MSQFGSEEEIPGLTPSNPQPESQTNLQHIRVSNISGPLVVFFGPRNIGKTVTLLRLCAYINKYEVQPDESFRTDKEGYKRTVDAFNAIRQNSDFAPSATGLIDFLLLNVTYNGNKFCQILEAPGEHFFNAQKPSAEYPAYLNQILGADYKKIGSIMISSCY